MTDEEKLQKLTELNLRCRIERTRPPITCGPEPCRELCELGYRDRPGPPMRIAQPGNLKFVGRNKIHPQCEDCWARDKNKAAIEKLRSELGY